MTILSEEIRDDVIWTESWDETIKKMSELDEDGKIDKIWITGGSFVYKVYAICSPISNSVIYK